MARTSMNETERFLLNNWSEASRLEECMEGVRTKYKELCERVAAAVLETHSALDASVVYVTQSSYDGCIGLARKSWPGGDSRDPPGFYVDNLRLEILASEESDEPVSYLWVDKKSILDLAAARGDVTAEAKKLLGREQFERLCTAGSGEFLLYFVNTPSKHDLLTALAEGDEQTFVDKLQSHFDTMAQLVPVLDKLFQEHPAVKEEMTTRGAD